MSCWQFHRLLFTTSHLAAKAAWFTFWHSVPQSVVYHLAHNSMTNCWHVTTLQSIVHLTVNRFSAHRKSWKQCWLMSTLSSFSWSKITGRFFDEAELISSFVNLLRRILEVFSERSGQILQNAFEKKTSKKFLVNGLVRMLEKFSFVSHPAACKKIPLLIPYCLFVVASSSEVVNCNQFEV